MVQSKTLYKNDKWSEFSKMVKQRDGYQCLQCGRGSGEVTLQVHHIIYEPEKAPWEYALSDCQTLCKWCHAKEHGLIEPDNGWTLVSIEDLGGLEGKCERNGCGSEIRYAHLSYHPKWGYLTVGSTCIEHLTRQDIILSNKIINIYKKISNFIHKSEWSLNFTKKGVQFIYTTYKHNQIRIYGKEKSYSFQLAIKESGCRWHDYGKIIKTYGKSLVLVKELAYIALRGTLSEDNTEKDLLRKLYNDLKNNTCAS